MKISIGLVDDHQLFIKSLRLLINSLNNFEVILDAIHGKELKEKLKAGSPLPDIMLIDVDMPVMNGVETARWLRATYPSVRLVALSMNDKEQTVVNMIRGGCCSYLLKDIHPDELEYALTEIYSKNYYNSDINKINLAEILLNHNKETYIHVGERELEFLNHCVHDITYKEIAQTMGLRERTVDGYRESLFTKFKVQSRTGMVIEAIRRGLIKI